MNDGYQGEPNTRKDVAIYIKSDYLYVGTARMHFERQLIKLKGICNMGLEIKDSRLMESP